MRIKSEPSKKRPDLFLDFWRPLTNGVECTAFAARANPWQRFAATASETLPVLPGTGCCG
jgi:hypothetical protein